MTFAPKGWVAVELPPETGMGLKGIRRGDRVAVVGVPVGNGGAVVEPALLRVRPSSWRRRGFLRKEVRPARRPQTACVITSLPRRLKMRQRSPEQS